MPTQLTSEQVDSIIKARSVLPRAIAVINGKGGQGKTTCTAQLGSLMAEALRSSESTGRVLVVDMDPQGNLGLDLGYQGTPGDDGGMSIVQSVMGPSKLTPIRDVRPNLDALPGGDNLEMVPGILVARGASGSLDDARMSFLKAIADIAPAYDWILFDCPPLEPMLQDLALITARWAVSPVTFDEGARQGLAKVSKRFTKAAELNPELELLGVIMYAFAKTGGDEEVGQRKRIRAKLEADLRKVGSEAPVFKQVIRRIDSAAEASRERGQVFTELESATDGPKWWDVRAGRVTGTVLPTERAATLADEFQALAGEIFGRVLEKERETA
ncbi:ParA family protein [Nocardiopsis tropica]|uniref:AAA family ATPase n=1 Tax=Nocardiopsis tropica TaxID=109330 RepID=A0ABU7KRU8_9ACTN|nr:AAA family ATPase [Nocardiopsis umidischolae]MEE2051802.1 AAA family ATPase [Nocardiopsis umidischolae]